MKNYFLLTCMLCLLTNCINKQPNDGIVERISVPVTIVNDSIETVMPGELFLTENYILWTAPINSDMFVHVLDRKSGKEVGKIAKIGQGPDEFVTPSIAVLPKDELFIYDLNSERTGILSIPVSLENVEAFEHGKMERTNITNFLFLNSDESITFSPSEQPPFSFIRNKNSLSFGKLPVEGDITEPYHHFQGKIAYNPKKKQLVYSAFSLPYFTIYSKKKNSFEQIKEVLLSDEYEIKNGIFSYHGARGGAKELALTSKYIVTLERDREFDDTDERKVGRDFTKLSHTVFLYDYDLQLKKIINLGAPILRLTADVGTNTLYAIIVNPDFMLVKCEL